MYCRRCKYPLREVFGFRCPECGADFDPADPRTYLSDPPLWTGQRFRPIPAVFWGVFALLLASAILGLAPLIAALMRGVLR